MSFYSASLISTLKCHDEPPNSTQSFVLVNTTGCVYLSHVTWALLRYTPS